MLKYFKDENSFEIKNIFISTTTTPSNSKNLSKKQSNNTSSSILDINPEDDNNTALFLAKINAHITSNLNKKHINQFDGEYIYNPVNIQSS